ncbi:MAG TPA: hypothetical protein PLT09_14590 [Deltaproteobacteria bacterium]|nr:hypothetical protein [Deltaproteobacteria bacterium]HPR56608.1 hypothetical protein [Deltaproteobacteria bacterium]HXK48670.1 hypothetical protein [Deltaproteobacteria bacterium]
MDDRRNRELFALLYETASTAGIEVIEDRLNRRGGVCRVDGRVHVIFDEQAPWREKNRLIIEGIGKMDLDAAYLPPKVRNILDERQEMMAQAEESMAQTPEEGKTRQAG